MGADRLIFLGERTWASSFPRKEDGNTPCKLILESFKTIFIFHPKVFKTSHF
jgi:hypothetical protein